MSPQSLPDCQARLWMPAAMALAAGLSLPACTTTMPTLSGTPYPKTEERVVVAGNDIIYVGPDRTGIMFVGFNNLHVEFLDTDDDGASDFVRYLGPRTVEHCSNVLEDYDADGLFDMRSKSCDDVAQSFVEIRMGESWHRVEGADEDRHVVIEGTRHPVTREQGRLRVSSGG